MRRRTGWLQFIRFAFATHTPSSSSHSFWIALSLFLTHCPSPLSSIYVYFLNVWDVYNARKQNIPHPAHAPGYISLSFFVFFFFLIFFGVDSHLFFFFFYLSSLLHCSRASQCDQGVFMCIALRHVPGRDEKKKLWKKSFFVYSFFLRSDINLECKKITGWK